MSKRQLKGVKKQDLVKILVEEFGYEKSDLKNDEGKPYTNAELVAIIEKEEEDAQDLERKATRVVKKRDALKDDDQVWVMNGLMGTLVYKSDRTHKLWKFTEFGQMDTMEYRELVTIRNRYPRYFTEGWLIVLDSVVQDEFKLTDVYQNIITPDNIEDIFTKSIEELSSFIDNLPEGMKNTFVNKAMDKFKKGELDSIKVIKLIEEKFGFSLDDNSPVKDIALNGKTNGDIIYIKK